MAKTNLLKLKKGAVAYIAAKHASVKDGETTIYRLECVGRKYRTKREDGTTTKVTGYVYMKVSPNKMQESPILPATDKNINDLRNLDRVQVLQDYKPLSFKETTFPNFVNHDWFKALKTGRVDAACFTTNLSVSPKGNAVLGAGLAKEVQETFLKLKVNMKATLGRKLSVGKPNREDAAPNKQMKTRFKIARPNVHHLLEMKIKEKQTDIYSFPVKEGFWEFARVSLIRRSCEQMVKIANEKGYKVIIVNFPGIGNGKLGKRYKELHDLLCNVLDNRFTVLQKPMEGGQASA